VRRSGNDPELVELAIRNAMAIGAGHSFIAFLRDGFPVNVLNQIKLVPEVCRIYCATANPVQVIVAETTAGRGILGVVDGESPLGVETESDVTAASSCCEKWATSSERSGDAYEPRAGGAPGSPRSIRFASSGSSRLMSRR
jgi:adenosine/AMP kinase